MDDQARARLGYFEAEHHMLALDQELAELKQMSDCPPSEWGLRAADPAVRVQRIDEQIPAILGAQPPGRDLERERIKLEVACEALGDILRATTKTLSDLSDPDEDRRGYARNSLELRRRELMRILDRFQFAFRDVRS